MGELEQLIAKHDPAFVGALVTLAMPDFEDGVPVLRGDDLVEIEKALKTLERRRKALETAARNAIVTLKMGQASDFTPTEHRPIYRDAARELHEALKAR